MTSEHIISSSEALEDINVTAMAPLPAPAELQHYTGPERAGTRHSGRYTARYQRHYRRA